MCAQFGTRDLTGFGCQNLPLAIGAAAALLQYVKDTQRAALPHLRGLRVELREDSIILDAASRRNLELDQSQSGRVEHSLAGVLDSTATAMGGRLLRRWLNRPLRSHARLRKRHQCVEALQNDRGFEAVHEVLRGLCDLERVMTRVALKSARPRDLSGLRDSSGAPARFAACISGA